MLVGAILLKQLHGSFSDCTSVKTSSGASYLRRRLASGEGIVSLGVTQLCVYVRCISLGGEGNALYPVLSSCQLLLLMHADVVVAGVSRAFIRSVHVCVSVCVCVCMSVLQHENTGYIIAKPGRRTVHDKSWSSILFEVKRSTVKVDVSLHCSECQSSSRHQHLSGGSRGMSRPYLLGSKRSRQTCTGGDITAC